MNSLLITGGSGFLGGNLALLTSSFFKTYITQHKTPVFSTDKINVLNLNIIKKDEVVSVIKSISPNVIIHTAAMANFNLCSEQRQNAKKINILGTENIALAAEQVCARLIYISTDLVFKGDKSFYREENEPTPQSNYGLTKLAGEKIVSSMSSNYSIARTAIIYGCSVNQASCFTEQIINLLKNNKKINLFTDEYRTPVYIKYLCKVLLELASRQEMQGTYNISGNERLSRYEFGLKLAEVFGFNKNLVVPVSVDNFRFKENRPKDCSMNIKKLLSRSKVKCWSVEEGLKDMKKWLKSQ